MHREVRDAQKRIREALKSITVNVLVQGRIYEEIAKNTIRIREIDNERARSVQGKVRRDIRG